MVPSLCLLDAVVDRRCRWLDLNDRRTKQHLGIGESTLNVGLGDENVGLSHDTRRNLDRDILA